MGAKGCRKGPFSVHIEGWLFKAEFIQNIVLMYGDLSCEAFKGDGVYHVSNLAKCATPNLYLSYERKTLCNCVVGQDAQKGFICQNLHKKKRM